MNLDFLNDSFNLANRSRRGAFDDVLNSNESSPDMGVSTPEITHTSSGSDTLKAYSTSGTQQHRTNLSVHHFLNAGGDNEENVNSNDKYQIDVASDSC